MTRIIDVTWPIREGMTTPMVPWHPEVEVSILGRHQQEGRASRKLVLGTHIGTHMDAPYHYLPDRYTIDETPLERLVSKAIVLDMTDKGEFSSIEIEDLEPYADKILPGDSVIINSGWWRKFNKPGFYEGWPCLTQKSAQWLIDKGIVLIAMDMPSPDDPRAGIVAGLETSPIHRQFFRADVTIVEYLANLDQIRQERVTLLALPLPVEGGDGAPARVLVLEE